MPLIPANITEFREPFIGGGSVFLAVKSLFKSQIRRYWINDLNYDLYCFWKYVRDEGPRLVETVKRYKSDYAQGRELYTFLKDHDNMPSDFDKAVRFFIMNRITFSGVSDSGGYSQRSFEGRFTDSSIDRLQLLGERIGPVDVTNADYAVLLHERSDNASDNAPFIFLDPPYYSATASKLYGVKGNLHTGFDHERFASEMRQCTHRWLITYDDSPEIHELFDFATIIKWELQYGMNNYKQGKADKGKEIFIKNY